jgi:eukaryotic-like serine/threonine-protein kinase
MVGRKLGKYHIVETLGRGGMGTVYKAIDETLDREVAIKILNPDLMDAETVERFRREAITLAKLNHPCIAHVYELTRDGDSMLMVMEYVRGETFEKLSTRSGPLPLDRAIILCTHVLEALHHAHAAGVVHRDLKPANLMLTALGDVKVMDFGIARVAGTEHMTNDGFMMGTPAYMAPEQVRGHEVDPRTDVYSMAVVLYRLVTAQLPFKADTAVAMIQSQLHDPPTPLRRYRSDLPDWLDAVLAQALAKSAADRYQTAEQLRDALQFGLTGSISRSMPLLPLSESDQPTLQTTPTPPGLETPTGTGPSGTLRQPSSSLPVPPPLATGHTTVILQRRRVAGGAAVFAALIAGVALLAYGTMRDSTDSSLVKSPVQPQHVPVRPAIAAPVAKAAAPAPPPSTRASVAAAVAKPALRDAPLTFRDVKFITVENSKPKETDALLALHDGKIIVRAEKSTLLVYKTMPYRAVVKGVYDQSKKKRYLTLQSKSDYIVLHLDRDNANLILPAIESRTGVKIQRLTTDQ